MKMSRVQIRLLRELDVSSGAVEDIDRLLKMQHSGILPINEGFLYDTIRSPDKKLVVAIRSDKRIVGVGILVCQDCLSHWLGSIHNFILEPSRNYLKYAEIMLRTLADSNHPCPEVVRFGGWVQDERIYSILEKIGFKKDDRPQYKMRLRRATRPRKIRP